MALFSLRGALCCLLVVSTALSACQRDREITADKTAPAPQKQEEAPPAQDDGKELHAATKGELRPEASWPPETTREYPINAYPNYTETGDLDAIKKRGTLRILADISNSDSLHREATQQDVELEEAKLLAKHLGLEPVVLFVDSFEQLAPALMSGKGDIVANHLVVTDERREQVDFSIPTSNTEMVVVSRTDTENITDKSNLKGKVLAVTRGTVYERFGREFVQKHPGLTLKVIPKNYVELVLDVSEGNLDFTLVERQTLEMVNQFKDNLKKNFVFPEEYQMAWAMRKNSPQLQEAVNKYVSYIKLTKYNQRYVGDLDSIKQRGVIRMATRNHPGTYYMWKGRILGYEYELAQDFAKFLGVRLAVIVAPSHEHLFRVVEIGEADFAASLLSVTERRQQHGMAFGPAYMQEKVVVVGRDGDDIKDLQDLAGRKVYVRKSANHYDVALRVKKQVPQMEIVLAPEELNIQQIIDKVADGEYDLAIADDISVKLEHSWRKNIDRKIDLHIDDNVYGWMVRENNPLLLAEITRFFNKRSTQKKMRALYKKYFDTPKRTRVEIDELNSRGQISPFDDIVKKYADKYDFDWRLVVAQMFQESTFNPKAKSWVGARGLMQVMPDTGKQVGEKNLFNPENSVRAGIKYLEWLHEKFEDKDISPENMMWFTLASYNAGLGHVYDAQDLAEEKGWDRRVWFNNVENAMLLLSEKKYYEKARFGFARGREPFDYVRKIHARFRTYVALLEDYERRLEAEAETGQLLDLLYPEFVRLVGEPPVQFTRQFSTPLSGIWQPVLN